MLEWEKKKKGRPAECRSNLFFFFFLPSLAFVRILLADLSADSSAHADRARVPNAKMSSDHTVGLIVLPRYSERNEMKTDVPFLQSTRLGALKRQEEQCGAGQWKLKGCRVDVRPSIKHDEEKMIFVAEDSFRKDPQTLYLLYSIGVRTAV